jgi:hypothetical protein
MSPSSQIVRCTTSHRVSDACRLFSARQEREAENYTTINATGGLDAVVRRPRGAYGVFSKSARYSIMTRAQLLRLRLTIIYIHRSMIHIFIIYLSICLSIINYLFNLEKQRLDIIQTSTKQVLYNNVILRPVLATTVAVEKQ